MDVCMASIILVFCVLRAAAEEINYQEVRENGAKGFPSKEDAPFPRNFLVTLLLARSGRLLNE
jgi:hypothetical protein